MKRQDKASLGRAQLVVAGSLVALAADAFARAPNAIPEPSLLSLVGAGVVAGIIAYRIKKKK
jgi:hypothetical protein